MNVSNTEAREYDPHQCPFSLNYKDDAAFLTTSEKRKEFLIDSKSEHANKVFLVTISLGGLLCHLH